MKNNATESKLAPIVMELAGGVGNQLFQYNFGVLLSQLSGRSLVLDVTSIYRDVQRCPDIMHLIPPSIDMTKGSVRYITKRKQLFALLQSRVLCSLNRLERIINRIYPYREAKDCDTYQFFDEKSAVYQDSMYFHDTNIQPYLTEKQRLLLNDIVHKDTTIPLFVRGYWQDMRLYRAVKERDAFCVLNTQQNEMLAHAEKELQQRYAVDFSHATIIHVRRTDFLLTQYPQCSLDYYRKAVQVVLAKDPKATFLVFTDDAKWCATHFDIGVSFVLVTSKTDIHQKHISLLEGVTVYTNSFLAVDEMILMNSGTHYIHSNSSFAWWGARLRPKSLSVKATTHKGQKKSIIVAPFPWFEKSAISAALYGTQWDILNNRKGHSVSLQQYTQTE